MCPHQLSKVRPEFAKVAKNLAPILYDLPPVVISIDGRPGVGKTTLGRFLAWNFNMTLVESDLFLNRHVGTLVYRLDHLKPIFEARLRKRPILVEGAVSLRLLAQLGYISTYHIRVTAEGAGGDSILDSEMEKYLNDYPTHDHANLIIDLPIRYD
ncbi:hypothetical protein [Pontivivens nitratireducens]|uniref:Uncharacterized protein n=1 Tax=Pontivivens nitratireducens TaxID=2758038 RepID=A0A6G7VHK4_9RHOB|nr:hypothetical protein [Pontibrevibacter nitratireducens]QIK39501.1 hypothetical protein G8E03_01235 [Pontibrevibacter nitratireducens]